MKKRILISSILAIVLCFSMITGATFALFTSESKVNIAVTSGKVEVTASVDEVKTYSKGVLQAKGTFENGGTAVYDEKLNELALNLITPGDKVELTTDDEVTEYNDLIFKASKKMIFSNVPDVLERYKK